MVGKTWGVFKFGFFLILIDLTIDGLDLLPDMFGWMLIAGGLHALAEVHPAFRRARLIGWLIVAGRLLGLLGVSWFEFTAALPIALPAGPLWSGASRLAAALPDLLELAFAWNVSAGLIAGLEFSDLPADSLRRRLDVYRFVALAAIGIGLLVGPATRQPIASQINSPSSAGLPLAGLLLVEFVCFALLLLGWRQAFLALPDALPVLPASAGWQPGWLLRARQRVRRPYVIAGMLALSAWLIWAAAFNQPPSGQIVHQLAGGMGIAESGGNAAFSPDGARLAVVSLDGPTKIYAADSGALERELPDDHTADLAFSPDGRQLALIGTNLIVYDAQSGRELWRLPLGTVWPEHVRWSPDGRRLAVQGGYVSLVDVEALTITATLDETRFNTYIGGAIAYSPDGTRLASSNEQAPTAVWDAAVEQVRSSLDTGSAKLADVAWSPDGTMLATADDHNIVTLWDVAGERIVRQIAITTIFDKLLGRRPHGHMRSWTSSLAFSPDGTLLAAGSSDASAGIWSVATGRQLLTLNGQTDYISSVAFSPDGRQVLTASTDQTLRVWKIEEAYK